MKMFIKKLARLTAAAAAAIAATAVVGTVAAQADDYPNAPIKVIVPYGPGGSIAFYLLAPSP